MSTITGYILRSQTITHLGTRIQRLEEVHSTGRRRDRWAIVKDEQHYVLAATKPAAAKAVMAGGLDVARTPLTWLSETETRRLFTIESATR